MIQEWKLLMLDTEKMSWPNGAKELIGFIKDGYRIYDKTVANERIIFILLKEEV